jgi:hypothetical protein
MGSSGTKESFRNNFTWESGNVKKGMITEIKYWVQELTIGFLLLVSVFFKRKGQ